MILYHKYLKMCALLWNFNSTVELTLGLFKRQHDGSTLAPDTRMIYTRTSYLRVGLLWKLWSRSFLNVETDWLNLLLQMNEVSVCTHLYLVQPTQANVGPQRPLLDKDLNCSKCILLTPHCFFVKADGAIPRDYAIKTDLWV